MTSSYLRGHKIHYADGGWVYSDTLEPAIDNRPCARCGRMPTEDGYDACLGHVPGAVAACCGHGVESGYIKYDEM